ncbi:MAG: response regulator [Phycisphaeraceae bacterium]|nr:response regulator [Phycisphaeraceae bacterium]
MASRLVLICDDQPHIELTLKFLVSTLPDTKVMSCSDGEEAMRLAIEHRPDLILLDVMMPRVDGYAACEEIRRAWGDHPGKIWFITARGSSLDHDRARQVGADEVINKPFDPDRLLNRIREACVQTPAAEAKP